MSRFPWLLFCSTRENNGIVTHAILLNSHQQSICSVIVSGFLELILWKHWGLDFILLAHKKSSRMIGFTSTITFLALGGISLNLSR